MIEVYIERALLQELKETSSLDVYGIPSFLQCETQEEVEDMCRCNGLELDIDEMYITSPEHREECDPIYLYEVKETE